MEQIVIVRYGELPLKSRPVRSKFKMKLIENISSALGEIPFNIEKEQGRIFVRTTKPKKVSELLSYIPGIVSSSPAEKTNSGVEDITKLSREIFNREFKKEGSFAIKARRIGNHEFSSRDLKKKIGSEILKERPNMEVDLDSPDFTLHVEVRGENAYIFTEKIEGVGGLPAGTQGKVVAIFSKPINALVSSYLMLKRGTIVYPAIFKSEENNGSNNLLQLSKNMLKIHPQLEARTVEFKPILKGISKKISEKFEWLISQRLIYKMSEKIAEKIGAKAIITDLDFDQISSISLNNIGIIEKGIEKPVFYPLLGIEKEEINKISKRMINKKIPIKTPKFAEILPNLGRLDLKDVRREEKKIPKESLINSTLEKMEIRRLES